ncbi:MAG TPA: helix-turn-helix domain-containing protein [Solirubrobacterales bacterium]|nr:helix-turn-helix domain-containing protein [Solirubrobacterales bacterium]
MTISPQAARVLMDSWRSQILSELAARPMSPSQFVSEFGGELDRISRCFRELAEWDYLELEEEVVGEGRRGGVEHVYRLVRRSFDFDGEAWRPLPPKAQETLSRPAVRSFRARIEEGVEVGIYDREIDSHLALDAVLLDRAAWTRFVGRLNDIQSSLPRRATAAARRLETSGGEAIPTTVALAGFRSPEAPALAAKPPFWTPSPQGKGSGEEFAVSAQLAHVMRNRSRSRILRELSMGPLSAPQFARRSGVSLDTARRHFGHLFSVGLIDLAEERKGRSGSPEKVYRAKYRVDLDEPEMEELSPFMRQELSASIFEIFWGRVRDAIGAGTFDQETDSHFDWDRCVLDRQGWRELMAELGDCLPWLFELEQEAAGRLERSGEPPIPTTYFLAGFRAPEPIASVPMASPRP